MALAQRRRKEIWNLKKSCAFGNFCVFFATSQSQIMFFQFLKKNMVPFSFPKTPLKNQKMRFCKMPLKNTRKSWKNTRKTWWIVQNTPCTMSKNFRFHIVSQKDLKKHSQIMIQTWKNVIWCTKATEYNAFKNFRCIVVLVVCEKYH